MAFVAPAMWMMLDRTPPYIRVSGSITPTEASPGETVSAHWTIRPIRICVPHGYKNTVTRSIVDSKGIVHHYDPTPITESVQQNSPSIETTFQLPASLPPGPARYHSEACYACNPIQEFMPVCVTEPDITFTIMPAPVGEVPPDVPIVTAPVTVLPP